MANSMTYELNGSAVHGGVSFFERARRALADYRVYRTTLSELEQLNDRELADLGISRLSIREIAYQSVYGN